MASLVQGNSAVQRDLSELITPDLNAKRAPEEHYSYAQRVSGHVAAEVGCLRRMIKGASVLVLSAAAFSADPADASAINDPYLAPSPTGNLSYSQWYLDKTGTSASIDINVRPAWEKNWDGTGQVVAVLDRGIESTHPDIYQNFRLDLSTDLRDSDPDPTVIGNNHGTAVASIVGAPANGVGMVGVASGAYLAAIRVHTGFLFNDNDSISKFSEAITYRASEIGIKNYSGADINAFGPVSSTAAYQMDNAARTYAMSGGILVVGTGNRRESFASDTSSDADANRMTLAHIPQVLTVAPVNAQGRFSTYGNFGANTTVCAPGDSTTSGLLMADPVGNLGINPGSTIETFADTNYSTVLTGVSYAVPQVSGGLAIAKQAHEETFGDNLSGANNVRYYKHLLAKTAQVVDPADNSPMGGWTTNAADYHFNNNYGFGLLNITALAQSATEYSGVSELKTSSSGEIRVDTILPSYDSTGLTRICSITEIAPLEEVLIRLKINESDPASFEVRYGQLTATLVSPSGTESLLMYSDPQAALLINDQYQAVALDWTFMSNAFWGENPCGTWSLTLSNPGFGTYEWSSFEVMTRSGQLTVPEPASLGLLTAGAMAALARRRRRV